MIVKPSRAAVIDNNVVVSAIINPFSSSGNAIARISEEYRLLTSLAVADELRSVLSRSKFDRYLPMMERLRRGNLLLDAMDRIEVVHAVAVCRDKRDDKFLELALSGDADLILTGDDDLLQLNPWRGIQILSPATYLAQ